MRTLFLLKFSGSIVNGYNKKKAAFWRQPSLFFLQKINSDKFRQPKNSTEQNCLKISLSFKWIVETSSHYADIHFVTRGF